MQSNKRILSMAFALVFAIAAMAAPTFAANGSYSTGDATIGFSSGGVYYLPYGISGVEGNLNLDFGEHSINTASPTQLYPSMNTAGYTVSNETGGAYGYRVTLGLSSFDNGLEGATLTLKPDSQGAVSNIAHAQDKPVLIGGQASIVLEADGVSPVVVMEATDYTDPTHTALGIWGFNFTGDLTVFTNTIRAGKSRSVMTWNIEIV